MKKRKRLKTKKVHLEEIKKPKKNNYLFFLVFALIGIILLLSFVLLSKKNRKKEALPKQESPEEIAQIPNEKYSSIEEAGGQIKGKIAENRSEYLIIEELFPEQKKIRLSAEELKMLKLQKIILKENFSKTKMDEIQEKIKSIRNQKSDELGKDNPRTEKITGYDDELEKLLNKNVFELVEAKEAKIEDFVVGNEITFSRLQKDYFLLTVYPSALQVYFPE